MTKINNMKITNTMILALAILTVLAFGLLLSPKMANAGNTGTNYTFGSNSGPSYNNPNTIYSNASYSYQTPAPIYTPAPTTTNEVSTNYDTPTIYSNTPIVKKTTTKKAVASAGKYQGLAANTIFGDNGFMPSGLLGWILLSIFLLLIIIFSRLVYGGTKKFMSTPLKHS